MHKQEIATKCKANHKVAIVLSHLKVLSLLVSFVHLLLHS